MSANLGILAKYTDSAVRDHSAHFKEFHKHLDLSRTPQNKRKIEHIQDRIIFLDFLVQLMLALNLEFKL